MEEEALLCKEHKMEIILICKTPKCKGKFLCLKCVTTTHKGHECEEIDNLVGDLIRSSKETLSKVAKTCEGEERKQLIKWLQGKKREIEAEYEKMIVQVSKFIIAKRNIHLKEIEQYLESLKSNIKLIQISKELVKEGRNIITQNTKKKYTEVQRIAKNITKLRNELEQKMQQELKSDKSKLRAEIEGKIVQKEKEFEDFRKLFLVQFKGMQKSSNKLSEEAGSNNYLHLLDNKSVYIYDIREESMVQRRIMFNGVKKDIPGYSRYTEQGGNIYLCGGRESKTSQKRAYILNKENGELREISPMKVPRDSHALVSLYPHHIYAIGGYDCEKETELSSCEVLDVRRESWSKAPQLLRPKCNIGGCSFDNTYIYIFGGWYQGGYVDDIEFLHSSLNSSWTPVSIQQQHNLFGVIQSVACAQINSYNIIIYGGYNYQGGYQDKSFIFDLNTMKITQHYAKLKKGEEFDNNSPVIYEDKLYNIGDKQNIHIFDLKSLEFDIIHANIWKK